MGNCKDCKHWQSPERLEKIYLHSFKMGRCELAGSSESYADHPESLAFAEDVESYSAWLNTSPDFGCVQWEAKDAT